MLESVVVVASVSSDARIVISENQVHQSECLIQLYLDTSSGHFM